VSDASVRALAFTGRSDDPLVVPADATSITTIIPVIGRTDHEEYEEDHDYDH
jgi:hypothetical protein